MSDTPGWDAINDALAPLYGRGEPPFHSGTLISFRLGGPDPLDGISVYPVDAPTPHWHFVSFGLSELYDKTSDDPDVSGYGFELTIRLTRAADEEEPPAWVLSFLQNLARYVFGTGNVFAAGQYLDANGPIALDRPTDLRAVVFAADPELPAIDTPNGRLEFLQIVGIHDNERAAIEAWNSTAFLELMREESPLLVTDLGRPSLLSDPALTERVREGTERDGSSMNGLYVNRLETATEDERCEVVIGANQVESIRRLLRGRLPYGRPAWIMRRGCTVTFEPAEANGFAVVGDDLTVRLTADAVRELASVLEVRRGDYRLSAWDGLTVRVVPTEIRDKAGNILDVVG